MRWRWRAPEIGLGALQLAMDGQAAAEVMLPGVTGADGEWRGCRERSRTTVVTMLGPVTVRRIAYRSREKGVPDLHVRDAVLNLPPRGYSWQLQKVAEMACRSGTYEHAREIVEAATGVRIGKRQLQEILGRSASDAEAFARDRPVPEAPVIAGPGGEEHAALGVVSADGKGVSDAAGGAARRGRPARPRSGRERRASGSGPGKSRRTSGSPRPASSSTRLPPDGEPRTPEDIMLRPPGAAAPHPAAVNQWYTCGITATCAEVIALVWPRPTAATPAATGTGSPSSTATPTRSSASRPKPRNAA